MNPIISAQSLAKNYGKKQVLKGLNLSIGPGRIVGLIGPNGSGKTTTLQAILGLSNFDGELSVMGLNPQNDRAALMQQVSFIADVAILPRWLKVHQTLAFVEGVHPRFERAKAEAYLAKTKISLNMQVSAMSKGMVVQLHLALIMAINAKLLILDEPTLGLDIMYRKMFYQNLLEDYFDENKTIIITTHQVEEVESILSDVIFLREGEIILSASMDEIGERFLELQTTAEHQAQAQALGPLSQRSLFGKTAMLFDGVAREKLQEYGDVRLTSISELFVAMMKGAYV